MTTFGKDPYRKEAAPEPNGGKESRVTLSMLLWNVLGAAIIAFGIYNVHSVSDVTEGGILGLSLLLEHFLSISPAVSNLILDGICYLIGWRLLGRRFILCSAVASGSFSVFYAILERYPRVFPGIGELPLLAAVVGAVFVGVGTGICVRSCGAASGDDALAMSLSHKLDCDIRLIYLISDALVLFLSLSYLPLATFADSLLTVFLSGQIIGMIQKAGRKSSPSEP